ncbi:MAG: hypothetical protein Q7U53_00660 [Anaerolineaceae bacterium]|nr:hypothetical protein [Anaerolineaceae bacterium]
MYLNFLFQYKKWGYKGFLSIIDQVLFSGSNFLVNILLARWITPEEYGAFAIAFSIYLFFAGISISLTLEPMMIFGSTYFKEKVDKYLTKVFKGHIGLSIFLAFIFLLISIFTKGLVRETFIGASISLPFMLMVWFCRRKYYIRSKIDRAAIISGIYSIVLLAGIIILKEREILYPYSIYVVFIIASLISVIYYKISNNAISFNPFNDITYQEILVRHWNYGKWIFLASIASSITNLVYIPILGLVSSLDEAAAFKAIQNLTLPFQQLLAASSMLTLPFLSNSAHTVSKSIFTKQMRFLVLFFLSLSLLYSCFVLIFGRTIIKFLYSSEFYIDYYWLIPSFSIILIFMAIIEPLTMSCRAFEKPKIVLKSKIISAISVLVLGLLLVPNLKLQGIIICMITSIIFELMVILKSLLNILKEN